MYDFTKNKVNKRSLSHRKPVQGIGINDAEYMTSPTVNGKKIICPYYRRWHGMLQRCYSTKLHAKHPTYKHCTVCSEWLTFSAFKIWMIPQHWQGLELDKDIKVKGNKVYSPGTCLFIPQTLNSLLNNCAASKGKHPVGVSLERGMFRAEIHNNGNSEYLGHFITAAEASQAYQTARANKINQLINNNTYPIATAYLSQHIMT